MMPVSSPGWFNDLPEYMTEAEWSWNSPSG